MALSTSDMTTMAVRLEEPFGCRRSLISTFSTLSGQIELNKLAICSLEKRFLGTGPNTSSLFGGFECEGGRPATEPVRFDGGFVPIGANDGVEAAAAAARCAYDM